MVQAEDERDILMEKKVTLYMAHDHDDGQMFISNTGPALVKSGKGYEFPSTDIKEKITSLDVSCSANDVLRLLEIDEMCQGDLVQLDISYKTPKRDATSILETLVKKISSGAMVDDGPTAKLLKEGGWIE